MSNYVFARLISGESILGLTGNNTGYVEKAVRIEFKFGPSGDQITELSAILPFDRSVFPNIHASRLLCEAVPVIEELNIELITIYNSILNGVKPNIKGNYLFN